MRPAIFPSRCPALLVIATLSTLATTVTACTRSSIPQPAPRPATPTAQPATQPAATPRPDSARAVLPPTPLPAAAADSFLVRFVTSKGEFDVVFRTAWAPIGVARVHEAVADSYYDGARFFRALRGFVVQWGLAPVPARTAAWSSRRIPDDPVTESNRRGTITFAAGAQPGTRSIQLFINLRDNARLDATRFAPLGEVVRGMDVVDALHTGYGDSGQGGTGPAQARINEQGEDYLAREFPLLDRILTARVVARWPGGR